MVFPDPESIKKGKVEDPYQPIVAWFNKHELSILKDQTDQEYVAALHGVTGLAEVVDKYCPGVPVEDHPAAMEFVLHGLAAFNEIGQSIVGSEVSFGDLIGNLFDPTEED
jgi:magnesium chelatase subunit I